MRCHRIEQLADQPVADGLGVEDVTCNQHRVDLTFGCQSSDLRHGGDPLFGDGGGVGDEGITVHAVPRAEAPAWLMRKHAEGYELDLKLWAGLWMIEHNPDGSRVD